MASPLSLPPGITVFERGWLSSNNILFTAGSATALVDSGYVSHSEQTVALVAWGLRGRPLDQLITTHLHSDHCGGHAALQEAWQPRTYVATADARRVADWREDELTYRATGQDCPRFRFDETLSPHERIELGRHEWTALAAPGHDPHSLMLYCAEEGLLISADALWENGFGVVFPELEGQPGFAEVRATLDTIAQLEVRGVIPGHGAPFTDVRGALERAYSRLDYLESDPARNALHAIKVLLKFRLLTQRSMALSGLAASLAAIPFVAEANRRYLQLEPNELTEKAVASLEQRGAARRVDGRLENLD